METTEVQVNLNDTLKSQISSLDYYLIHQVAKPTFGVSEMEESAKHFLNQSENSIDNTRTGVSAIIFKTFFSRNLNPDQKGRMDQLVERIGRDSEVVRELDGSIGEVDKFVGDYFARSEEDFAVWMPRKEIDHEFAKTVLDLKAQVKMRDLRKAAKKDEKGPEYVFESFVDPKSGRHGIWISSKGFHHKINPIV